MLSIQSEYNTDFLTEAFIPWFKVKKITDEKLKWNLKQNSRQAGSMETYDMTVSIQT